MTRRIEGHCYLCGEPAAGLYCHTHQWAAGQLGREPEPQPQLTLTKLHAYWLERHTPDEIVELAAGVAA